MKKKKKNKVKLNEGKTRGNLKKVIESERPINPPKGPKKRVSWERRIIERDGFFPLFQKVIKSVEYPTVFRNITTNNGLFRFLFRWQDKDTCGIEVFHKIVIE